jgi:hypothetical protein
MVLIARICDCNSLFWKWKFLKTSHLHYANTSDGEFCHQSYEDQAEHNQRVALLVEPQYVPDKKEDVEKHCKWAQAKNQVVIDPEEIWRIVKNVVDWTLRVTIRHLNFY